MYIIGIRYDIERNQIRFIRHKWNDYEKTKPEKSIIYMYI